MSQNVLLRCWLEWPARVYRRLTTAVLRQSQAQQPLTGTILATKRKLQLTSVCLMLLQPEASGRSEEFAAQCTVAHMQQVSGYEAE